MHGLELLFMLHVIRWSPSRRSDQLSSKSIWAQIRKTSGFLFFYPFMWSKLLLIYRIILKKRHYIFSNALWINTGDSQPAIFHLVKHNYINGFVPHCYCFIPPPLFCFLVLTQPALPPACALCGRYNARLSCCRTSNTIPELVKIKGMIKLRERKKKKKDDEGVGNRRGRKCGADKEKEAGGWIRWWE